MNCHRARKHGSTTATLDAWSISCAVRRTMFCVAALAYSTLSGVYELESNLQWSSYTISVSGPGATVAFDGDVVQHGYGTTLLGGVG